MKTTKTTTAPSLTRSKLNRIRAGFYRTTDGRFDVHRLTKRGGWSVHDNWTATSAGFALMVSHHCDTLDAARGEIRRYLRRKARASRRPTGDTTMTTEHMLGMAEALAVRTADNFLQELTELLSTNGPAGKQAIMWNDARIAPRLERALLRDLRKAAADAVSIALDLE